MQKQAPVSVRQNQPNRAIADNALRDARRDAARREALLEMTRPNLEHAPLLQAVKPALVLPKTTQKKGVKNARHTKTKQMLVKAFSYSEPDPDHSTKLRDKHCKPRPATNKSKPRSRGGGGGKPQSRKFIPWC